MARRRWHGYVTGLCKSTTRESESRYEPAATTDDEAAGGGCQECETAADAASAQAVDEEAATAREGRGGAYISASTANLVTLRAM